MIQDADTVLREALALTADERAGVAADLIASLDDDGHDTASVQAAWADELERRARRMLEDPSRGEDRHTVRDRVADRLSR